MMHSEAALRFIDDELRSIGITEYRFCKENDCYICPKEETLYSVCHRQFSKARRLVEKYRLHKMMGVTHG